MALVNEERNKDHQSGARLHSVARLHSGARLHHHQHLSGARLNPTYTGMELDFTRTSQI